MWYCTEESQQLSQVTTAAFSRWQNVMDCPMNLDKYDEIRYKMLKCNVRVNEMNITSYG